MAAFNDKYIKYNCKDDGNTSTKKNILKISHHIWVTSLEHLINGKSFINKN